MHFERKSKKINLEIVDSFQPQRNKKMATHTEQYLQKEIRKMMSLSRQIQPLKLQRNTSKRKIDEEKHRFNKSMDKADSVSR